MWVGKIEVSPNCKQMEENYTVGAVTVAAWMDSEIRNYSFSATVLQTDENRCTLR